MTLQAKFTKKYGISPLKLVEDTNYEYLGFIKKNNLTRALERYIEEKKLNIEVNSEFEKDLVEAFAEAGERFPESGKISSLEKGVLLSIPNVNAGVPKSKGTLENFKEVVGTDELRPVMSGVFVSEDGKELVGTDAHKLVVQKTNEYSEYAGKIIDLKVYTQTKGKKITFIDGKYPNYNAVIPRDNPNEVKNFDTYALYNAAKSSIAVHKLVEQTLFNLNLKLPTIYGDGTMIASFNPVIVADVTTFALVNGWNKFTFEYSAETRAYILNFGEGNIALIMPIKNSYGEEAGLHGGEVMTPEEIMDKYKFAGKMKSVKPAATKPARPSAPVSSEPFKEFKGEYDEENTTYVLRRDIESITLTSGEVLGKNDVVQGFYRVKKKMAHGGSMYADGGNLGKTGTKTYKLRAEGLNDFLAFLQNDMYFKMKSFTIEPTGFPDVVVTFETSSSLSEIKEKLKEVPDSHVMLQTVKPINEYTGEREEEGEYAHGGSMYADGGKIKPNDSDSYYRWRVKKFGFKPYGKEKGRFKVTYIAEGEPQQEIHTTKEMAIDTANRYKKIYEDVKIFDESGSEMKYAHGGSMYADGGGVDGGRIPNNYKNKTESEIWQNWTSDQKYTFLYDHCQNIGINEKFYNESRKTTKPKKASNGEDIGFMYIDIDKIVNTKSSELPRYVKFELQHHVREGQYAHGGSMYEGGGTMGRVKVGTFNEAQLKSGEDKLAIEKAQKETGLTYIDSKITKKGGKMFMEVYLIPTEEYLKSAKFANGGSMYAGGGKIDPIDMAEVESSAIFYTEKGKWSPEPTVEKFENQIREYQEMKRALDNKEIRPSKVIGTGIKPQYVRPLAYRWIEERTLIAKRAIEILKERMGGAKSSSHEVGDTVTFNSVMGGTKTGTIISKMGEEGFRIQVGNGFATVKKSAIV